MKAVQSCNFITWLLKEHPVNVPFSPPSSETANVEFELADKTREASYICSFVVLS